MRGNHGRGVARSQTQGDEGVGGQNPKTELLELGFVRVVGNIGGGRWGDVVRWLMRGDRGHRVVRSQT
jgi:hypothetical protein